MTMLLHFKHTHFSLLACSNNLIFMYDFNALIIKKSSRWIALLN